jgi:subtilisin family serine protease
LGVPLAASALLAPACSDSDGEDALITTSSTPSTSAPAGTDTTPTTTAAPTTAAPSSSVSVPDANDPLMASQWAVGSLRLPEAWSRGATGEGTVIAVVDTGVDLDHPDLQGKLVPGYDVVDGDDLPDDGNGHGTHVAGIAAATTGNGIGVAGTAPGAKIMPVRVLGDDGSGSDEAIAEGIDWAIDNGADVINLSLGETGVIARLSKGGPLNAAIRRAAAEDVVVVAASGNEGAAKRAYRIGVPVLVVNAVDQSGEVASFSNVGDQRAVSAPGVQILSTAPLTPSSIWPEGTDGYEELDGTSMAAPLVSGVAAILVGRGYDVAEVIERISSTADNPDGDPAKGAGTVDPVEAAG